MSIEEEVSDDTALDEATQDEIEAIITHDPFAKKPDAEASEEAPPVVVLEPELSPPPVAEAVAPVADPAPVVEPTEQPTPPVAEVVAGSPPAQPAPVPAPVAVPTPELTALREQLDRSNALVQQMMADRQAAAAAPAVPPGATQAGPRTHEPDGTPVYEYDIPEAISEAMFGAETTPQAQRHALQVLVKGAAQAAHRGVMQAVAPMFEQQSTTIQQNVDQERRNQTVYDDFYGTYPHLAQFRTQVQDASAEVVTELERAGQASTWSPKMRDLIARRTQEKLAAAYSVFTPATPQPGVPVAGQRASAPVPVPVPPVQMGVTTRPGGGQPTTVATEIEQMMFGPR